MSIDQQFKFEKISCPVCSSENSKFLGWRGGEAHQSNAGVKTSIVRCRDCSHQYPNPMPFPQVDLDELYVDADEYFRGHDVERKKRNGLRLVAEFERKLGKKGTFLDVGCGVGEILWAAKQSGWEAEGIDPSKQFIEIGRSRLGVEGRAMTLEQANYPDEHFDAIVMSGIVEHLYNPLETLREIHRVLKPDGWFWFDAPNEDGFYMQLGNTYMKLRGKDWLVSLAPTFPPYHVQGFNTKSLKKIVELADFKLIEMEIFGDISSQTGKQTLRKKIEFNGAKFANWLGKMVGKGMYMSVWTQKK